MEKRKKIELRTNPFFFPNQKHRHNTDVTSRRIELLSFINKVGNSLLDMIVFFVKLFSLAQLLLFAIDVYLGLLLRDFILE